MDSASTSTAPRPGRPDNLRIQGQLIRQLREELGLTQAELTQQVYLLQGQQQGRQRVVTDEALRKQCQRWEEGAASLQHLPLLASALGCSVRYLREGGTPDAPPDRTPEAARLLLEQVAVGNPAAMRFMGGADELQRLGCLSGPGADTPYRATALALTTRLAHARLTEQGQELQALASPFGITAAQAMRLTGAHAHWLVATKGPTRDEVAVVLGATAAIQSAVDQVGRWPAARAGGARATVETDGSWVRVHLRDPHEPLFDAVVSLTRCEAGDGGLRWMRPTAAEAVQLRAGLQQGLASLVQVLSRRAGTHWPPAAALAALAPPLVFSLRAHPRLSRVERARPRQPPGHQQGDLMIANRPSSPPARQPSQPARPANLPSKTGNPSGPGRSNMPPRSAR